MDVADQERTTCGIHTVFNARTRALCLGVPNTASAFRDDPFMWQNFLYEDAAMMINLALGGRLSSDRIFDFLVICRYVDQQFCPQPDALRCFDFTIRITSTEELTQ